ncbi:hypothetical protein ACFW04_000934 [Cataglyphis niger]
MLANFLREYNINRLLLSSTGLWPFQSRLVRNSLLTFCLLLEISYCPFEILLLYDHWDDGQIIFEGCYQIVISSAFLVRMVNEILYDDKFRQLYETIDEHWNIFTSDTEVQVLKHYSMMSRQFTKYYSMLMYVMMSAFIIIPLTPMFLDIVLPLNESRPRFLAIEVEFRVDKDEYFLPIFCYTTAIIVVGMSIIVSVDAMMIASTAHACSLFAAIGKEMENKVLITNKKEVGKYEYHMIFDMSNEEIVYREYIKCLKKHQLAIKFVDILDSSNQGVSLILLVLIVGTLSLIGIRIVYVLDQLEEIVRFMFIIMGALLILLIMCYSGQRLMDESQNIFFQVYAAKWYDFSPRLKSLLIIILYRSNVSCGLKAGNIVPLSTATFAAVSTVKL